MHKRTQNPAKNNLSNPFNKSNRIKERTEKPLTLDFFQFNGFPAAFSYVTRCLHNTKDWQQHNVIIVCTTKFLYVRSLAQLHHLSLPASGDDSLEMMLPNANTQ